MIKSVAIVTGANQGIGQTTAVRLARDLSALSLGCAQSRQSRADGRDSSPQPRAPWSIGP
jgi:NAD(P)-dependent dehydrogenase (short-subunit alcohol dehydrogenase family)